MYDNDIYSGAGAGSDISGADGVRDRETELQANEENGGVGMKEEKITGSSGTIQENSENLNSGENLNGGNKLSGGTGVYSGQQVQDSIYAGSYGDRVESTGTGNTYGSNGTGNASGSNGTGNVSGSTGTKTIYGSTGTGSTNTGSSFSSVNSVYGGTGNSYGSVNTGSAGPNSGSYNNYNSTNDSYYHANSNYANSDYTGANNAGSGNGFQSNGSGGHVNGAENNFYNEYETSPVLKQEDGKKKKVRGEKKQGGYFRKLVLAVSLGLFFGLFAGIGFVAVQQASAIADKGNGNEAALSDNVEGSLNVDSGADESKSGIKLTDTSSVRVVSSDVTDVVDEVMPAMVSIVNNFTQTGTTIFGQTYSQDAAASGTGIIVAESEKELLIVSNHHVVADATKLDVTFIDGSTAEAQIKGTDSDMDLAVIAIPLESLTEDTKSAIAIATLGDSDALKMGEPVIAIGNALGYGQSVTNGIVSALDRAITLEDGSTGTFIQTNAAINPGNSGGALLNVNGEVIGINSNKIGGSVVEGMGYAIPISAAKPIIADLMLKETRTKVENGQVGYMGITLQTITEQFSQMYKMPQGVYVTGVEEGSPAKEAGLLSGDIIVNFDGEKISSYEDLQNVLQYYGAGSTAKLVVKRPQNGEYQSVELEITLGSKPASQQ